jgi:uncharacterized membrane protein
MREQTKVYLLSIIGILLMAFIFFKAVNEHQRKINKVNLQILNEIKTIHELYYKNKNTCR